MTRTCVGRRAAAALLGLALLTGGRTVAQELVLLAPGVDDVWLGAPGRLHVQCGSEVLDFERDEGGRLVARPANAGAAPDPRRLAAGTELFDLGSELVRIARDRAFVGEREHALPGPLLRRPWSGTPLRLPLRLGGGLTLLPGRPASLLLDAEAAEPRRLELELGGRPELGWGIGDELLYDLVVPHVLARRRVGATPDLIIGSDRTYELRRAGDEPLPIAAPPGDTIDGIMDFPYTIVPQVADLDGAGGEDLVLADPSAGAAILYLDLEERSPEPSEVILVGGVLLATWVRDLDGDERVDLVLLRLPPLSLPLTLEILEKGRARGEILYYPGQEEGAFEKSPAVRLPVEVPLELTIRNDVREVRLPSLILPVPGPELLQVHPDGKGSLRGLSEEAPERELARLPPGRALRPFDAPILEDGLVVFAWVGDRDARVYTVDPR